jgi:hypothetical protein
MAAFQCVPLAPGGRYCPGSYLHSGTGVAVSVSGAMLVAGGVILMALPGTRPKIVAAPIRSAGR